MPAIPQYNFQDELNEALIQFKNLKNNEVIELCEKYLATHQVCAEAFYLLAGVAARSGTIDVAIQFFENAIKLAPEIPNPYFALSMLLSYHQEDKERAFSLHRMGLIRIDPNILEKMNDVFDEGTFFYNQKFYDEAIDLFKEGLEQIPCLTPHRKKLADSYFELKEYEKAEAEYRQILLDNPCFADAYRNLALTMQRQKNRDEETTLAYEDAIRIWPQYSLARTNFADFLRGKELYEKAYEHLVHAFDDEPKNFDALKRLADTERDMGLWQEARASYKKLRSLTPEFDGVEFDLTFTLPQIIPSKEIIPAVRQEMEDRLEMLQTKPLSLKNPMFEIRGMNFYSPYFGFNEREPQMKAASAFRHASPILNYTAPNCLNPTQRKGGRIRLGILSTNLNRHSVGRLLAGTLIRLPKDIFEIFLIKTGQLDDVISRPLEAYCDHVIGIYSRLTEGKITEVRDDLANLNLDLLFFTDIGMDVQAYFLSFMRLAPIQFSSWFHPVTSGVDTMDYFLSCPQFEGEGAQNHFSEQLILGETTLQSFMRNTTFLNSSQKKTRSDLGLPENVNLYGCPQSLYKIHPDFDDIMAGILRQDPTGLILLLDAPRPAWRKVLEERFETVMPDVAHRIKFMPRGNIDEIMNQMYVCDVLLDPLHFGGGVTSLEAFSMGVPVVTLPSPYTRARLTLGYYKDMGVMDCVVNSIDEFVQTALDIAKNKDRRADISKRILTQGEVLFDNPRSSDDLTNFMLRAHEARMKGGRLTA